MKQRLDTLLVERGLAATRSSAQAMIMAGQVKSGTTVLSKPGQVVEHDIELSVASLPRYVSRGGDKLASVADQLRLNFDGAVVLDVGSSTGGFTDYALQHGATKVYAVDVGTNQLAYKLRQNPRVEVFEQTDIRKLTTEHLDPKPTIAVIDVSFVSLTKILNHVSNLLSSEARIVAMMKPQFETDKPTADRHGGVIKDEKLRQEIIASFEESVKQEFTVIATADSAVHGPKGNRERFYLLEQKHPDFRR